MFKKSFKGILGSVFIMLQLGSGFMMPDSFAQGGDLMLGGFSTPRVTVLGAAHRLTGNQEYLDAMQYAVNYVLGGNQMNMANTSATPYTLAPRPAVSLNLTEGAKFPISGCYLTVNASKNTRAVEYYYGWRYIGESTDKEDGFKMLWRPGMDDGSEVLLTAVAYSDRGRKSLPSVAGENRLIVSADVECDETVEPKKPEIPDSFRLYQNRPNPFNLSTRIWFDVPHPGAVAITIFDLTGRKYVTLVDEVKPPFP